MKFSTVDVVSIITGVGLGFDGPKKVVEWLVGRELSDNQFEECISATRIILYCQFPNMPMWMDHIENPNDNDCFKVFRQAINDYGNEVFIEPRYKGSILLPHRAIERIRKTITLKAA